MVRMGPGVAFVGIPGRIRTNRQQCADAGTNPSKCDNGRNKVQVGKIGQKGRDVDKVMRMRMLAAFREDLVDLPNFRDAVFSGIVSLSLDADFLRMWDGLSEWFDARTCWDVSDFDI